MAEKPTGPTRQQKWRKRHPKKYLAHLATQNALRLGVIKREPCAICGAEKAEFHHSEGYDRPYSGTWLCRKHHIEAHRQERIGGRK